MKVQGKEFPVRIGTECTGAASSITRCAEPEHGRLTDARHEQEICHCHLELEDSFVALWRNQSFR